MRMKVNDQDFYVTWFYSKLPKYNLVLSVYGHHEKELPYSVSTECRVYAGSLMVGYGITYCSIKDNFNKKTGRKISLARAVSKLDKWTRKEIWDSYWKQVGGYK